GPEEIDGPVGGPFAHMYVFRVVKFAAAVACESIAECGSSFRKPPGVAVEGALHGDGRLEAPLVDVEAVVRMPLDLFLHTAANMKLAEQRSAVIGLAPQAVRKEAFLRREIVIDGRHSVIRNRLARKDAGARRRADRIVDRAVLEHRPL